MGQSLLQAGNCRIRLTYYRIIEYNSRINYTTKSNSWQSFVCPSIVLYIKSERSASIAGYGQRTTLRNTLTHSYCFSSCSGQFQRTGLYDYWKINNYYNNRLTKVVCALRALDDSYISVAGLWLGGCCCIHSRTSANKRIRFVPTSPSTVLFSNNSLDWSHLVTLLFYLCSKDNGAIEADGSVHLNSLYCVDLLQVGFTLCSCCAW